MNATMTRRKPRLAPYVAVAVAALFALFVLLLATSKDEVQNSSALIGKPAPAVVGTGFRGDSFDLDAQRGKWTVVNFFSTTCTPCILEHPELKKWAERHASAGDASIVSVTFDDSPASVQQFFEQNGGDWPVLVQDTGSIAISYGVTAVPESYLVDPFGVVRVKFVGGVKADDLDEQLARYGGGG
jgi:cytochrome c biogenesis protein CcmG, thiol:disulfide interchange protein DsbE